jgi:hypothetical protein
MAMSKFGRTLLGLAVATSLSVVACSDASRPFATAPDAAPVATEQQNLLGGLLGLLVAPVQRTTALANDVTWSFNAGPLGGYTANSSLGMSVAIPPGALDQNVTITVTAFKGKPIAYGFSPHLEFDRKVIITQSLKGTSCGLLSCLVLKGAHFAGSRPTYSGGLAIVDEVVGGLLSTLTRTFSFGVDHFTGWIVASGMAMD